MLKKRRLLEEFKNRLYIKHNFITYDADHLQYEFDACYFAPVIRLIPMLLHSIKWNRKYCNM